MPNWITVFMKQVTALTQDNLRLTWNSISPTALCARVFFKTTTNKRQQQISLSLSVLCWLGCLLPFSPLLGLLCFLWLMQLQRSVLLQDGQLSFQWLPGLYANQLCRFSSYTQLFISLKNQVFEEWLAVLCHCSSPGHSLLSPCS